MENLKSNRMGIYKYNLKGRGKKLNVLALSSSDVKTFTYRCIYSTSIASVGERDQNDQNELK
jgi:hypothetical protein